MVKEREISLIITNDGSHSLQVPDLNETYHSRHGAIQESEHVFIKNGLEHWIQKNQEIELSIFEVGFGTGLNVLLSILKAKELDVKMQYHSIELYPLTREISSKLNYAQQLECDQYILEQLHSSKWEEQVSISSDFTLVKINDSFEKFESTSTYDLVYFDAFAPSKQPEMWSYSIIKKCFEMLNPNGIFVTYSAKGQLKRDLKKAGFTVESLPGPPGKFEMVRASKM